MIPKIILVVLASVFLGGCTLPDFLQSQNAASDEQPELATSTPAPSADQSLESIPAQSTQNDPSSLETDLNNTIIYEEDFSDLD